MITIHN